MTFLVSLSLLGLQIWVTSQPSTGWLLYLVAATFVCSLDGHYGSICVDCTFLCVILWLVSMCPELFSLSGNEFEWLMSCGCWVSLHQRCVKGGSRKHRIVPSSSPAASVYWQNLNLSIWLIASHFKAKIFSKISIQHVCAVHKDARRVSDPLQM